MHLKNGKKLYNERGITFFHESERYVNNLNIYNNSKNGTNLWDDLTYIFYLTLHPRVFSLYTSNNLNRFIRIYHNSKFKKMCLKISFRGYHIILESSIY